MSLTTRVLVLGVVRLFQPVHGYHVRRELTSWHAEEWASVAPGSIYNALRSLTRDGLVEVASTDQVGSRPERTLYRLTPSGEQELSELLRDTWWTVRLPLDPLAAGVALISFMNRDEAIAALEARTAHVRGQVRHMEISAQAIDDVETPAHVRELLRLLSARLGAEVAWAEALIRQLRGGAYRLAGDPPAAKPKPKSKSKPRTAKQRPAAKQTTPAASPSRSKRRRRAT